MEKNKADFLTSYFEKWSCDIDRAEALIKSEEYFTEGILSLSCYIGALGRLRYPSEPKDWKLYKKIVAMYSDLSHIYDNIDLLFFMQWPRSRVGEDSIYCKMKKHDQLSTLFSNHFGDIQTIKESQDRYQKRTELIKIVSNWGELGFDNGNFEQYIELFSNFQILYQFLRCDAVHNNKFSLFTSSYNPENAKITYYDNHQITRELILKTVKNIVKNLSAECVSRGKRPHEL